MKKKITALLVGIFTLIVNTYAQFAPSITFTATPTAVCAGATVSFASTSVNNPTTWTWYFPGGTPSTFVSTVPPGTPGPITYSTGGTYYVTCVVRNAAGADSVTATNLIQVTSLPVANVTPALGGICGGNDSVYLNAVATGVEPPFTYMWAPGGGLSCTGCPNPAASPNSYTVYTVTITNSAGCQSMYTDTINVNSGANALPAKITGRDTLCMGMPDTLIASGGASNPGNTTYFWEPGGKTSAQIIVSPNITTVYSVTITTDGSCQGIATFTVVPAPMPSYTITSSDSICYPNAAKISIFPGGNTYLYSLTGPFGVLDTNVFIVSPAINTTYTLVIDSRGCYIDSILKIKVNTPPVVKFTGATNLCQGSTTTIAATGGTQYHWSNGSTQSSITVQPPVSLTYTVQVNARACRVDTSFTVIVDTMPSVKFSGDTSICIGDSTTIYVSGGTTYLWNTGSTADSIFAVYPNEGQYPYHVTVTKGSCSKDSLTEVVKVYAHPNPSAYPVNTTICQWDSVKLTAAGGNYYVWTPANSGLNHYSAFGDTDRNNASPAPGTTQYYVNICSWGCCKKDSLLVNIVPGVEQFSVCCSQTVQGGTAVDLSATYGPGDYQVEQWTPATGLSCATCPNPVATVTNTTKYIATFIDLITGCTVNDSATITVFNCNVFVPNVFSPEQSVNNILYVRSLCLEKMTFSIYDRFGNQVFSTQNQPTGWDGTYNGKPMEMGTYIWYLTGLLTDGTSINKSGNVTLLR